MKICKDKLMILDNMKYSYPFWFCLKKNLSSDKSVAEQTLYMSSVKLLLHYKLCDIFLTYQIDGHIHIIYLLFFLLVLVRLLR